MFGQMAKIKKPLILIVALFLLQLSAADALEQDGSWRGVRRIVAIGDVHGDFDRFVELLRAAGVVNGDNSWIGGKSHLVQTGDILDRGPSSKRVMDLLRRLEKEAEQSGGKVHALIGNHEAMVILGKLSYVHPGELKAFHGEERLRRALGPDGEYGTWIRGHNAVIRINDVLFLHGGISPSYADHSIAQINASVRAELAEGQRGRQRVVMDNNGPLWYRGYANEEEARLKRGLAPVLKAFDVRHIVVGHTVAKKGIQTRSNGQIIMIDVGFSRTYVGASPACLLIEDGEFFSVTPQGRKRLVMSANPVTPEVAKSNKALQTTQ